MGNVDHADSQRQASMTLEVFITDSNSYSHVCILFFPFKSSRAVISFNHWYIFTGSDPNYNYSGDVKNYKRYQVMYELTLNVVRLVMHMTVGDVIIIQCNTILLYLILPSFHIFVLLLWFSNSVRAFQLLTNKYTKPWGMLSMSFLWWNFMFLIPN